MRLRMFGATDIGFVRKANQDAHFFNPDFGIAIVSDGMGGHQGGEIASELVVTGLKDAYLGSSQILIEHVGAFLDDVLGKINANIIDQASRDPHLKGMGATVNYLQFGGGTLVIGHAGDSRTYLIRNFKKKNKKKYPSIWQLTIDHTLGSFIDRGVYVEGRDYQPGTINERTRARLTRGMGVVQDLKADIYTWKLQEGDVFLTCSDGLHGYASDDEILQTMFEGPLSKAPQRLLKLAHSKGAPDNITVVISTWGDEPEPLLSSAPVELATAPFLVRNPSGEIHGIFSAEDIIQKFSRGMFTGETEVAASRGQWVFLNNQKRLTGVYPEFAQSKVRQAYDHFKLEAESVSFPGPERMQRAKSNKLFYWWLMIMVALFITAAILVKMYSPR